MKISIEELAETEVKGANGQPLKLYHGTRFAFDVFSDAQLQSLGFHFGDIVQANHFAGAGPGARVIPVYLIIHHLIDTRPNDAGWQRPKLTALCLLFDHLLTHQETEAIIDSENFSTAEHSEFEPHDIRQYRNGLIIATLEGKGYDGILYTNNQEPGDGIGRDAYLVFRAHQIYSALTLDQLAAGNE